MECLNEHWFLTLADAQQKTEAWRRDYDEHRPLEITGQSLTEDGVVGKLNVIYGSINSYVWLPKIRSTTI